MLSTRKLALESGEKNYYTGVPCINGHTSPRRTMNFTCTECAREANRRARQQERDEFKLLRAARNVMLAQFLGGV